jgi:membrane protein DedA with SNARE-associated domain
VAPLSHRTLALVLAPVVALTVAAMVANALAPTLLVEHPLLLLALNPIFRYMVATATLVDPVPFYAVAVMAKLATDPIMYVLGRRYGDAAVRWIERRMGAGEYVRTVERWFVRARHGTVFLAPNRLVCTLAGSTRMGFLSFAVINLAGTLTAVTVARSLSGVLSGPIGAFVRFTDRYQWWLTALTVAVVLLSVSLQQRRGAVSAHPVAELEQELGDEGEDPPG